MPVSLQYGTSIYCEETLPATNIPFVGAGNNKLVHSLFATQASLDGASAIPVTDTAQYNLPLVAGAATIDLTALPVAAGTLNATGKRVRAAKFKNNGSNPMTLAAGGANGYDLAGATWKVILQPGQEFVLGSVAGSGVTPAVSSTVKTIGVTGTGTEQLQVGLVVG